MVLHCSDLDLVFKMQALTSAREAVEASERQGDKLESRAVRGHANAE